jgi:hypothetical protein
MAGNNGSRTPQLIRSVRCQKIGMTMRLGEVSQSLLVGGFLLVVACAGVLRAGEDKGPSSLFADLLSKAARDMGTDLGAAYHSTLGKALALQHGGLVSSCVHTFGGDGAEPFEAVVVVAADGKVAEFALDSITSLSKCIQGRLLRAKFPKPPFAPFHDRMRFSFKRE